MSVATAEPALTEEPVVLDAVPDGIAPPGIALSVALHLVLGSLFIFGLPRLFAPPPPDAMPEVPVADAPVARPEPEPPVPTPVPPPSAEAPPPTSEPPTPSEPK